MTATPFPNPVARFFGANNTPLSGGSLRPVLAGTSTPAITFSDPAGTSPNPAEIDLDIDGTARVFLDNSIVYDLLVFDAEGAAVPGQSLLGIGGTSVGLATTSQTGIVRFATNTEIVNQTPGLAIPTDAINFLQLNASQIANGTINIQRLPSLPASQITSGVFSNSLLPLATATLAGAVRKATTADFTAGAADRFIDAELLRGLFTGTAQSKTAPFFQILPGGLAFQWGTVNANATGNTTVTFARQFTTTPSVVVSGATNDFNAQRNNPGTQSVSTASFIIANARSETVQTNWIAIGFVA
jgi:hypothetical protein